MKHRVIAALLLVLLCCAPLALLSCKKDEPPSTLGPSTLPEDEIPWEKCFTHEGDTITGVTPYGMQFTKLVVPASINGRKITTVGEGTFDEAPVHTIVFSEGITTLESSMTDVAIFLQEVVLPESLRTIESGAFDDCHALRSITIPAGVKTIGDKPFDCNQLVQITNLSKVELLDSQLPDNIGLEVRNAKNVAFKNLLTTDQKGHITYTVGETVYWMGYVGRSLRVDLSETNATAIYASAQANHFATVELVIPETITQIGENAFTGMRRVLQLTNLSGIPLKKNIAEESRTSTDTPFSAEITREGGHVTMTKDDRVFWLGYEGVLPSDTDKSIELDLSGKGITDIYSFSLTFATQIGAIKLPDTLLRLHSYAFLSASGLEKITLPASLLQIDQGAFAYTYNLSEVIFTSPAGWVGDGSDGALSPDFSAPAENAKLLNETYVEYTFTKS